MHLVAREETLASGRGGAASTATHLGSADIPGNASAAQNAQFSLKSLKMSSWLVEATLVVTRLRCRPMVLPAMISAHIGFLFASGAFLATVKVVLHHTCQRLDERLSRPA
jgi:hypothetical protein